ncbi:50S ribosomal protein L5 [Candidatus Roizmanbacteria bacterium RIFCSPHIGHO2_01_FULL_39_12b]|uniref:Large ribosomal subunit protein uL5 n=1 Tax=Candidatus Roizmanbacteria bacterium RIFCSPHIGHO2_01_FULL_39_12b TaxID=1802030 RepID=A0A1F7GC64_9BACT|nr:MAG: 50S ribosomal protein L5 [Candidatus Roizmanbacteria bacterium RIFCSPHIGHO2_01_FULL_39_12b]OGK47096.1 MAG: 50S ribosomal protein L5 [Candidatus Roizmanbacteria bacterium RIFCSPLOWO2_01_FULL_39_19]
MKFKDYYTTEVLPKLISELKLENPYIAPRVEKIVLNIGVGEAASNKNVLPHATEDLMKISGQKPIITKAKRSISAFKIRAGLPIGTKVTLRGAKMYDFLEKLIKIVLPRIREFKGVPIKNFDSHGNLNIGITDQTLFPEIDYDTIDKIRGLEITIVNRSIDKSHAITLLKAFGMPVIESINTQ